MVQRDDLWRPEQYAVIDVESDVGHVLLPFYVDVLRGRPTRRTRGMMALSSAYTTQPIKLILSSENEEINAHSLFWLGCLQKEIQL